MQSLSSDDIKKYLDKLDGWFFIGDSIQKEYQVKSFIDAIALIVKIGIEAEKIEHHPDLLLHSWNKIKVVLSTHSVGGVTENDFNLAQTIDEIRK